MLRSGDGELLLFECVENVTCGRGQFVVEAVIQRSEVRNDGAHVVNVAASLNSLDDGAPNQFLHALNRDNEDELQQ